MPINIFDAPLGKQAINLTLSVQRLQLRSLVRQIRVITVNLQDVALLRTSDRSVTEKKKGKETAKKLLSGDIAT